MRVWVRNLTKDIDKEIILPITEEELDKELHPNDEYIIIDYDAKVLSPGQYDSIDELNEFLTECKEDGIEEETLGILSRVLLYNEVIEHVRKGKYIIVDFNAETAHWNCGRGGDFHNDSPRAKCGVYLPDDISDIKDIVFYLKSTNEILPFLFLYHIFEIWHAFLN